MDTFKDLEFKTTFFGIRSVGVFNNGIELSVVGSDFSYSTPIEDKEGKDSPDDFSSFEIAILDSEENFITKDFFPDSHDDVLGWQSREDINNIIDMINKFVQ